MSDAEQPRLAGSSPALSDLDAANDDDISRVWLPGIVERIAGLLPENEVACTLRLIHRATAQQFAEQTAVRPAQPVPRWCFAAGCRRVCRGLTLPKRHKLLCLTAASGDVANMEVALAEAGLLLTADAPSEDKVIRGTLGALLLEAAAGAGQLPMCQWLVGREHMDWGKQTATFAGKAAAAGGHEEVVGWCLEAGASAEALAYAALLKGHEGLAGRLMKAHPDGSTVLIESVFAAAEGGSLACLQRLWERPQPPGVGEAEAEDVFVRMILPRAVSSPTSDWEAKCAFLLEKGRTLASKESVFGASSSKSLFGSAAVERLERLRARGATPTAEALETAAGRGDATLVAYLLGLGLQPTPESMTAAAGAGEGGVEVLRALAAAAGERELPLVSMAHSAAARGSLAGLCWLVETYGVEAVGGFTSVLFRCACYTGNAELMAWLLARGCEADAGAWEEAAESGCEAALELLSERGCPRPTDGGPYLRVTPFDDLPTMAVLRRLGVSLGADEGQALFMSIVGRRGCFVYDNLKPTDRVPVLAWLLANGCSVNWDEAKRAAEEGMDTATVDEARESGAEVLEWLARQR